MAVVFRIDVDGNVNSAVKLRSLPKDIVKQVQNDLQGKVGQQLQKNIKTGMPVSNRSKQHMRTSNSLTVAMPKGLGTYRNYAITVKPTDTFWYMKFPNNGSGTSRNNKPKQFFQIGLKRSSSLINSTIQRAISKSIE